jgi:hypothetical protein
MMQDEDWNDYCPENICNRCDFNVLQREAAKRGHVLTTVKDGDWLRVFEDGRSLGVAYLSLPDKCGC